ncbi:hypothetical protein [uncultured Gammaproteobacteria bacterium]|nr:hypothetical protein [uncultured Gammaproteobacteria bacterium]
MNLLEPYHQTYTYDTGNNLTNLSHQAHSSAWQQTLTIYPNNNRGTETQQSTSDFDANGNLLVLNNLGTLHWHYNNTLNQLTKADKSNTTQYSVYDYQGNRVRSVVESNNQVQSQRDYLPLLDTSTNQAKQQTNTLHIGTHILSESSKDNTQSPNQTRYQLTSHLQSNTLELDDKAQTLSYEHYYPYGGTALIAGKDKTQVQQKRYRYTGKERDDSSGLCYDGARYLAPWLTRWISPDSAGAVDGLNLYAYVKNNPLKYTDPTGHVVVIPTISWNNLTLATNTYMNTKKLYLWIGESHKTPDGKELLLNLNRSTLHNNNIVLEITNSIRGQRPSDFIVAERHPSQPKRLIEAARSIEKLTENHQDYCIGSVHWNNVLLDKKSLEKQGFKGSSYFLVGARHLLSHELTDVSKKRLAHKNSFPAHWNFDADASIALIPILVLNIFFNMPDGTFRRTMQGTEFGVWIESADGLAEHAILALGKQHIMKDVFGDVAKEIPQNLFELVGPNSTTIKIP